MKMLKVTVEGILNRKIYLGKQIVLVCLSFWIVLCCIQKSFAQFDKISIGTSAGIGELPLKEWEDFAKNIPLSHFSKDRFGSYLDFRITYTPTNNMAITLTVENIKIFASLYGVEVFTSSTGDTIGSAFYVNEWQFEAVPIGLSYEFYLAGSEEKIVPFWGVGTSYFISEVKSKSFLIRNTLFKNWTQKGTRNGKGYGFHIYAGVKSHLTPHLQLVSRLRVRYADGMGFTAKKKDIKVEFTGVDFTLGIGWKF